MKQLVVALFGPLNQLQPRVGPLPKTRLHNFNAQRCPLKVADSDADGLSHNIWTSDPISLLNLKHWSFRSGRRQTAGGSNSCSKGQVKSQQGLIPPDISYKRFHSISEHDFLHVEVPFFSELTLQIIPRRQQILVVWTTRLQKKIPHHTKVIAVNY